MDQKLNLSTNLLQSNEPAPFTVVNGDSIAPMLLICDHASPRVPSSLGDLGLQSTSLKRHIAYDIGAGAVATQLSNNLTTTLILASYSRLVIDLNRPTNHPDSIVEKIDETYIPLNQGLDATARRKRLNELFVPYHKEIEMQLDRLLKSGTPPIIISIHSFSPSYGTTPRPWDVGVLWNRDNRVAVPLIEMLQQSGLNVGDNEPYSGKRLAYTLDTHCKKAGLPHCAIEINQKHISNIAGIDCWSRILTKIIPNIMKQQNLTNIERF